MAINRNLKMAEFPYSMSVGRMQSFLKEIPTMGIPEKVALKTLESRGYKSTNDRTIIPTLKFLGLIDVANTPTVQWRALRDRENYGRVMASIVREAYSGLFTQYLDAHQRSDKEIQNYMAAHSTGANRMVGAMVGVFKMLCGLADFDGEAVSAEEVAANRPGTDKLSAGTQRLSPLPVKIDTGGMTLQLHLTLPENATVEQIEMIFKNAAKYLLGRDVD